MSLKNNVTKRVARSSGHIIDPLQENYEPTSSDQECSESFSSTNNLDPELCFETEDSRIFFAEDINFEEKILQFKFNIKLNLNKIEKDSMILSNILINFIAMIRTKKNFKTFQKKSPSLDLT
ncbi:hypothetical protein BpHYR1_026687 [Brachionus plicatilis]|uniref:Uncharacterized protein n=1 Tax=Brachionus plicatilis TaxID=10195 RepID=A0A3M7RUR3_BRAPC|nr:hypothetical protein BpHYR1_026687 [Brachionus plicatilis]